MPRKTQSWINSAGQAVPAQYVPPRDKKASALVARHIKAAAALSKKLRELREAVLGDIDAFVDWSASANGVEAPGGEKGNINLTSFDGLTQIRIRKPEYIEFDERLQHAKGLIDQFISGQTPDARSRVLIQMINAAFTTTRDGRLRADAICAVQRRINLHDQLWTRAMQLIESSKQAVKAKTYIRFYARPDTESDWTMIPLNIADVTERD